MRLSRGTLRTDSSGTGGGELIERSAALSHVDAALGAAELGDGCLTLVSGPAGIGKTALLSKAAGLARSRGFSVLSAVATELERGFPFGVARQLYGRRMRDREEAPGFEGSPIAPLLLPLGGPEPALDVSFQVLDGLYWLVADLADERPLLIAVDDAQWADEPSLRHLAYLANRLDGVQATVLIAARSGEPPLRHLEDLGERAGKRIELPPLSLEGVAGLIRRTLGRAPSRGFASACLGRTGGYPLYLSELLREARDAGVEPTDAAAAELESLDAGRLAQHVWRRIEGVGGEAATVVGLVSVLGPRATTGRIARLGELPAAKVAESVEALAGQDVLGDGEPLRFTHPIVRAAVEERLPAGQLDGWHRSAARLLYEEGADRREVAAHLLRCHPDGDAWAAEQLRDSARAVLGRGAPEAAADELRRALAEGPPEELRVALLRDLARAEDAIGEPAAALAHYDDALRSAGDPRTRAEIALAKARTLLLLNREEAVATLEAALEALGGRDAELEQRIEAELIVHSFLSQNARQRGLRRLGRYEGRIPEGPAAPAALTAMAFGALLAGGSAREAAPLAERALRLGGVGSGGFGIQVWTLAAWTLALCDRPDLVQELTERELPAVRRGGHRREILAMESTVAFAAWWRGDLPTAVSRAETGLAIADPGPHQAWSRAFKAAALLKAGDLDASDRELEATSPEHWAEDVRGAAMLLYARAQLRTEQGRLEEADADVEEMRRRAKAAGGLRDFHDLWRPVAVAIARRRGDLEKARVLAAERLRRAPGVVAPGGNRRPSRAELARDGPGRRARGGNRDAAPIG